MHANARAHIVEAHPSARARTRPHSGRLTLEKVQIWRSEAWKTYFVVCAVLLAGLSLRGLIFERSARHARVHIVEAHARARVHIVEAHPSARKRMRPQCGRSGKTLGKPWVDPR